MRAFMMCAALGLTGCYGATVASLTPPAEAGGVAWFGEVQARGRYRGTRIIACHPGGDPACVRVEPASMSEAELRDWLEDVLAQEEARAELAAPRIQIVTAPPAPAVSPAAQPGPPPVAPTPPSTAE